MSVHDHGRPRGVNAIPYAFVLIWSAGAIVVKLGLQDTTALAFLALRMPIAALAVWLIILWVRPKSPYSRSGLAITVATGLLMQVVYQSCFFLALAYRLTPGMMAIILGTQPLLTGLVRFRQTHARQWLGLVLGLSGLILVVGVGALAHQVPIAGLVWGLLALLGITAGTLMQKFNSASRPILCDMAVQYSVSAVVLVVIALWLPGQSVHWTPVFTLTLGWMSLVVSVGATLLLYFMIQRGEVTRVTSLFFCVPPATVLWDFLLFGDRLSVPALIGMLLVVAGLILINRPAPGKSPRVNG